MLTFSRVLSQLLYTMRSLFEGFAALIPDNSGHSFTLARRCLLDTEIPSLESPSHWPKSFITKYFRQALDNPGVEVAPVFLSFMRPFHSRKLQSPLRKISFLLCLQWAALRLVTKTWDHQIFGSTYLSNKVDESWCEEAGVLHSQWEWKGIEHFWRKFYSM